MGLTALGTEYTFLYQDSETAFLKVSMSSELFLSSVLKDCRGLMISHLVDGSLRGSYREKWQGERES